MNASENNLNAGDSIWFVGYPNNRYDTKNNLPIMRKGFIASIPQIDFEGRREILIDAQVFGGSSGSPVFASLNGSIKLIGVVAQTMIKNQKIQSVLPTTDEYYDEYFVEQILGLGIVLKSNLLFELFDTATNHIKERLFNELSNAE